MHKTEADEVPQNKSTTIEKIEKYINEDPNNLENLIDFDENYYPSLLNKKHTLCFRIKENNELNITTVDFRNYVIDMKKNEIINQALAPKNTVSIFKDENTGKRFLKVTAAKVFGDNSDIAIPKFARILRKEHKPLKRKKKEAEVDEMNQPYRKKRKQSAAFKVENAQMDEATKQKKEKLEAEFVTIIENTPCIEVVKATTDFVEKVRKDGNKSWIQEYLNKFFWSKPQLSLLMKAIERNSLELVELLIKLDAPVNVLLNQKSRYLALHHAVLTGTPEIVRCLLKNNAETELFDNNHNTPLYHAIKAGRENIYKILVEEGYADTSDVRREKGKSFSALQIAERYCSIKTIKYFRELNKSNLKKPLKARDYKKILCRNLTKEEKAGRTIALLNIIKDYPEIEVDEMHEDKSGKKSYLLFACIGGDIRAVKNLIEVLGADPTKANSSSQTPLHFAARHGHEKIVKYIIKYCARRESKYLLDVDKPSTIGLTPLYEAIVNNHFEVVVILIKAMAKKATKDAYLGNIGHYKANSYKNPKRLAMTVQGGEKIVEFFTENFTDKKGKLYFNADFKDKFPDSDSDMDEFKDENLPIVVPEKIESSSNNNVDAVNNMELDNVEDNETEVNNNINSSITRNSEHNVSQDSNQKKEDNESENNNSINKSSSDNKPIILFNSYTDPEGNKREVPNKWKPRTYLSNTGGYRLLPPNVFDHLDQDEDKKTSQTKQKNEPNNNVEEVNQKVQKPASYYSEKNPYLFRATTRRISYRSQSNNNTNSIYRENSDSEDSCMSGSDNDNIEVDSYSSSGSEDDNSSMKIKRRS